VGYIEFFAASLNHVPQKVPHQNGKIYLSAAQHFLIPRFLNPNKEVLDDTKHTEKYTGIRLSGTKEASSFSLGYIADAYVDFGYYFMFVLLFIMGRMFGFFFSFLVKKSPNEVWVWIFTCPFLILLNINGTDTKKAIGWILIYFATIIIVRKQLIYIVDPIMKFKFTNEINNKTAKI